MSSYHFRHFLICISGFSGSGKDEFSRHFVEDLRGPKIGLADPAKRHMADIYGFTEDQLFGPSAMRNAGDLRYPKPELYANGLVISATSSDSPPHGLVGNLQDGVQYWEFRPRDVNHSGMPTQVGLGLPFSSRRVGDSTVYVPEGHPSFWLSPRESLQRYCELMNLMYGDTWIRKSINTHVQLGQTFGAPGGRFMLYAYDRMEGVVKPEEHHSVPSPEDGGAFFSCGADFRHVHEFKLVRKFSSPDFIPVTVRVKRPSVPNPPFDHRSETEQATIPDDFFDFVIENDGTPEELRAKAAALSTTVQEKGWAPKKVSL